MTEQAFHTPKMPSGYESSMLLEAKAMVDERTLPWLKEPVELSVSECQLQGGDRFLVASAVGTHPKLVEAADAMTEGQKQNTDNMFYSRIPEVISKGFSPSVETMPKPSIDFPIHVMRNNGGQRVYFARIGLGLEQEQNLGPVVVRLSVCDKNKQGLVMKVLSGFKSGQIQRKLSK